MTHPLHMVFLFHSWYVMLGFVQNMKIFGSEDLFWFQSYWSRDILHGKLQTTFRKFYGRHTWSKFDTSVPHMLKGLFTNCDVWLVSRYLVNRDGCHMWGRKCSLFPETHHFTPFGEFKVSPIHYIYYVICQSEDYMYVYGLMTGLFAWISLTALSGTYFIRGADIELTCWIMVIYVTPGLPPLINRAYSLNITIISIMSLLSEQVKPQYLSQSLFIRRTSHFVAQLMFCFWMSRTYHI